jgi:hypothetical protein
MKAFYDPRCTKQSQHEKQDRQENPVSAYFLLLLVPCFHLTVEVMHCSSFPEENDVHQ